MYKDKKILAIVPARGGSKGLPKKNIKEMNGKPLIAWSLDAAKQCDFIDEIFVSTDSQEIADVCEAHGVFVPHLRPAHLASDTSRSIDAILYTIDYLEKQGKYFDLVVLLEPTSPQREVSDIQNAIKQLIETEGAESIVGVYKTECQHPDFLVSLDENKFLKSYVNKFDAKPRQELEDLFFFEGTVYVATVESLRREEGFYHDKTIGYITSKYKSLEVDDIYDFIMIEALMKAKKDGTI